MTGAPMPDGADAVVMVERSRPAGAGRRGPDRGGRGRAPPCAARATTSQPGDEVVAGRDRCCGPPTSACWPASAAPRCTVVPRPRVGRAVHRRRAGRRRASPWRSARSATRTGRCSSPWSAAAGVEAGRPRPGARRRGRARGRACARARPAATSLVTSGGVSMGDFDVVKLGARPHRRHGLDADRHPPGQAVRVRPARRHPGPRPARQPGVVASCPSSCWPGPRCAGWRAAPTSTGPVRPGGGRRADAPPARRQDPLRAGAHRLRRRRRFHVAPGRRRQGSHQLGRHRRSADGLAVLPDGDGRGRRRRRSSVARSSARCPPG